MIFLGKLSNCGFENNYRGLYKLICGILIDIY